MLYNPKIAIEIEQARLKLDYLIENEFVFELTKKRKKRSIKQNSYLHVLFSLFGIEYGYSVDETKTIIKRELKCFYTKNDQIFLQKTSKMNTKELFMFTEKFRNYSSVNGLYLPSAKEYLTDWSYFDKLIDNNKLYL